MNILSRIILGFFVLFVGFFTVSPHTSFASTTPKTEVVQKYILEAYKLQGDKAIATFSKNLEKLPNVDKEKAYKSVQTTFILNKQSIQKNTELSKMTRDILSKYIDYIIFRLEQERKKLLK